MKINENSHIFMRDSEHVGILQLDSNKTYGRTENKKRLLYRCIPYNKELPDFLIPYEIKLGFHKFISNKYVIFKVQEWEANKHPIGLLVETIGDVGDMSAFCEYQLCCKNLNFPIKSITNITKRWLNDNALDSRLEKYNPIDRRKDYVFSIDPKGSKDLDDAFSVHFMDNGVKRISIHIANVATVLECMNLWNYYGDRVSTIYLPDRIRPMLPKIISEDLCSLLKGKDKIAFTMDIYVDSFGKILEKDIEFSNTIINVQKNYDYEDSSLESDSSYLYLKEVSKMTNSHDVVEYWMTYMNTICAQKLKQCGSGIFRAVKYIDKTRLSKKTGSNYDAILTQWKNINSQYVWFSQATEHEIMGKSEYIHITSPIRRLVDIINQILFLREVMNVDLSQDAIHFVTEWKSKLDFINNSMKSIRKIQNECSILNKVQSNEELLNRSYEGIVFDKSEKNGVFKYTVYLKELNFVSFMKCDKDFKLDDYRTEKFKIFLFENESHTKKKIRVHMI
jgi:exoribonuclease R